MRKKILFVISQFYKGGAEISLRNLLRQLDYSLLEVDFVVLNQCPIPGGISLMEEIPKDVNVCDAYAQNKKMGVYAHFIAPNVFTACECSTYPISAMRFVRQKRYDCAFHVGEWTSPAFVAHFVNADVKAAWIHNDLSKAEYFNAEEFFSHFDMFDYFVFVSNLSMRESVKEFPFLRKKARVIYNINDVADIRKRAQEKVDDILTLSDGALLVTCANVRPQKNFTRQVEAMKILKERGVRLKWINIGALADAQELNKVTSLIQKYELDDHFILLGPKDNPYKYMKNADAIAVLSDYESWSMVITEAKILGIPVIATKTSGALEQLEDGVTGVFTEFSAEDIAKKFSYILETRHYRKKLKRILSILIIQRKLLNHFIIL